ncbi:MAG: response regulator [Fulvimarina manganoxydans]|uniref:response regulator n=1 Tax=Fulvimarina manganoxydans TaxID=937218 RepID=UPI0023535CE2|nr:response regulator [Fulvimarina manganoxydans]MCK5931044.1 response regulator [Fulvimarina manganoxydans]
MTKTILMVDDSPSVRQVVGLTLKAAGYHVLEAADGAEALTKALANKVHAVITDLNMPGMDGLTFIRNYRANPASGGVPIVFLTTESHPDMKEKAKQAGATGWMVKPFQPDQLLSVVRKVAGQ